MLRAVVLGRLRAPGGGSVLETGRLSLQRLRGQSGGLVLCEPEAAPGKGIPAAEWALTSDYQAFFARFKTLLTEDFENALIRRQIFRFRWINSALAARSLAEILEERLLGDFTFENLSQRADLPEACRNEHPPLQTPEDIVERIAEIPTRFWLPSESATGSSW